MILRITTTTLFALLCLFERSHGLPASEPRKRVSKPQQLNNSGPTTKIYEVDQNNRVLRQWTKINGDSETVLEDLDSIRLECTSDVHPVQWLYFGHGAPVLTSNLTFSRMKNRNGGDPSIEYVATALISPVKEHHTGKYICSRTDSFDMRTFFYIYVPGPTLFSALNGQDILIPKNDTNILIPCTVSNPDVIVTLEKSINNVLQRVKPSLVSYNPKEGAILNIGELDDPEGIYVCTARYNNLVRGIEYTLRYPSKLGRGIPENINAGESGALCDTKCGDNAHCEFVSGQKSCVCNALFKGNPNDACVHDCHSHSDCPRNTVCFRDLKCRDPCLHSIRCASNALCRVENSFPVCYCPENFVGDPKTGCINSIQADRPSPLNTTSPRPRTSSPNHCSSKKCGRNGYCSTETGKEMCECRRKPSGDPEEDCEIPCESHNDCPDNLSCNVLRKCHSPCVHNIRCGYKAICSVIEHRPKCSCPRDTVGDPMNECTSSSDGFQGDQPQPSPSSPSSGPPTRDAPPADSDKCKRDLECASHEKCMKTAVDKPKECVDPCVTRRCGAGAQCKTQDHRTFCACKDGFEGNANKECRPIKYEEGAVEPLRQPVAVNCKCGPFSTCSLDKDGKQKCECLEGHIGQSPNCTPECNRNSDCALGHVCLRDSRLRFPYCAKVCGKKICGANALCREANGVIPADCECPIGFGGDAYLHCQNLNEKVGKDCMVDEDCGSTLRCQTGVDFRKCVDPCESMKCAQNLECSVQDHQATCICPAGYTGNPSIGCTRDAEFNVSSPQPCGKLSCGPHSECRYENDQPTCTCRSYALGEPPSCYQECESSSECELGLSCVQKRCRHSCSTCGINTKCLISRVANQDSICSCLDGFEGDPKRGCVPK